MNKETVLIGGWNFKDIERGLHFFQDDRQVKCIWPDTHIGSQLYDPKNNIDYVCEEADGFITALSLNDYKTISRVPTYGVHPTHCTLSKDGKYLMVAHHGFASDDSEDKDVAGCPINLYALNEDGSIGDLVDRIIIKSGEKDAQLHSVYCAPTNGFYIVNECGQDKLLTLKIADGKMQITSEITVESGYCPRYGVFHHTLPIFYDNNERVPVLSTYTYQEDGTLQKVKDLSLVVGDERETNNGIVPASDIVMHPNGKLIYVALRKVGRVVAVAVKEDGDTELIKSMDCAGLWPRSLCIDTTGEHIYVCNGDTNQVAKFAIAQDGTISDTGVRLNVKNAGNLIIY